MHGTAPDGYSYAVRKFFWQRWALIFMLVSRLVIGELGHAMPMASADDGGTAHHHTMAAEMPSSDTAAVSDHASADAATHSSSEQDCCKSGECECPCLHAPCASVDALVLNPIATALLRIPPGADGVVSQRPSGLFRPPA